jgi:hypothetical protein
MPRRLPKPPTPLARAVAAIAAGLVVILGILSASPELHERLHGHPLGGIASAAPAAPAHGTHPQAGDDEDGCVVTLFSQGLILPLALAVVALAGVILPRATFARADREIPGSPRYLRLPAQAPPIA